MKRLQLIFLSLFLLFSQFGSFDHLYHDHEGDEVCGYCLSAQPLDNAVTTSVQTVFSINEPYWQAQPTRVFVAESNLRYYAVRAPPRFL
ncbi:MAG: hypothetical protein OQK73_05385 [Gammaproteobacteria bacterium]|nr:hypothetical protein [Gammaproteobacteria bacterium]